MERPTRDDVLIRQAQIVAERSTCSRAHVGAVIAHESRVVSQGYNGAAAGMPHCDHTCRCIGMGPTPVCSHGCASGGVGKVPHSLTCAFQIWMLRHGDHDTDCPQTSPCLQAVHAEANAIAFAAKHGVATNGAVLYTTMAPCLACSQLIINAGIIRVLYASSYRYDEGIMLLMEAGITVSSGVGMGLEAIKA